jgi:hypothetical protein
MKKILMGSTALLLCVIFWAFTQPKEQRNLENNLTAVWFYYDGINDPHDPASYTRVPTTVDCPGDAELCAILADPQQGNQDQPTQAGINAAAASSGNFASESVLVEKKD